MNLKMMLEKTANQYAGNTAIVSGERRISYAELNESANKFANALIEMGVKKGDRVATLLTTSPEFVAVYFGILKAGGIAVPLDIRYKGGELVSLFANCHPNVLVVEGSVLEPLMPILHRFDSVEHIVEVGSKSDGRFLNYGEIMTTGSAQQVGVELEADDVATISYTGGPTSRPHGAMLTHGDIVTEVIMSGKGFQQTEKDVVMFFALPMYHMFGLASVLLTAIDKGSTVVIVPGTGRSISSFLAAIEKERGTIYLGVPYIYALAISVAEREGINSDLSSVRLWGSGGAPLPPGIREKFKHHYGFEILDIWGLTEAVSHVTYQPLDGTARPESSGKALPGWEIKIVDDGGRELPPDQPGEIIIRGPIMKGYYNNPEDSASAIKDGWLYTGDVGSLDEDGYLHLSGRKKRMIILKGQNVYPIDIEAVLSTHNKIARVKVTGIPDILRGEIVQADIKLKDEASATEHEIRSFCQGRMADYKLPKRIIFTNSVPEGAATKVTRKRV